MKIEIVNGERCVDIAVNADIDSSDPKYAPAFLDPPNPEFTCWMIYVRRQSWMFWLPFHQHCFGGSRNNAILIARNRNAMADGKYVYGVKGAIDEWHFPRTYRP